MDGQNDSVLVQRLDVVNTGRRRRWSQDEKLRSYGDSSYGDTVTVTVHFFSYGDTVTVTVHRVDPKREKD